MYDFPEKSSPNLFKEVKVIFLLLNSFNSLDPEFAVHYKRQPTRPFTCAIIAMTLFFN